MKIDKFFRDSFVLTLSNLVTGIIAFIFSIILSRNLGAEGLGLYGLIMPVYVLLICLTSEGVITAISKISAIYYSKKDFSNLNKTLNTIFVFIFFWGFGIAFLTFINASNTAHFLLRDDRSVNALKMICPALIFIPISAVIKGYFYGLGKFKIAAYVDIFEKMLRVLILLGTIAVLSLNEVKSMVTAAYFSLAAGEFISMIILYTVFTIYRKRKRPAAGRPKSRIQLLFDVLVISCPLCLNGFVSSVITTASTLIMPRRLVHAGFVYNAALSMMGKFIGMALNITYLPFIIITSMLTVLIPDLSISISKRDRWAVETRIAQVLKISCLVGISTLVVMLTVPDILGKLIYNRPDLGFMIKFAAIASFTGYVSSPTFGILNGLGKQNILLRNSVIVSLEGLVLIFLLTGIPALNIYGYGICLILTSITALIINIYEIGKFYEIRFRFSEMLTYALIGILAYLELNLTNSLMSHSTPVLKVLACVMLSFLTVYVMSRMTNSLNRQE